MRVFCTEGSPRPLEEVFAWVAERGPKLWIDDEVIDADLASDSWEEAAIVYRQGKAPFLAEVNYTSDPTASEEIDEYREFVEEVPDTQQRRKVLSHLERTIFIVANQIPTADFEDDGYDAVGEFMRFFLEHNGGMIQADAEGFYEGAELILEVT